MAEESNAAIIAAMAANAAITTLKTIAATITGSSAMMSEAVHSLVDTGDSVMLYVGKRRSAKPPDRMHPLGYGRELYFWTMVVAMVIFGAGGVVNIYEGIVRVLHPEPARRLLWNYAVLGGAGLFEAISFSFGFRQYRSESRGRRFFEALRTTKDPTTFAVIFEDGTDLIGIAIAGAGIWLGSHFQMPVFEGIASIAIGALLGVIAFLLGRECRGLLIGEAAEAAVLDRIRDAARTTARIEAVGDPLTIYFGPHQMMLALSVRFHGDLTAVELARAIDELETSVHRAVPDVKRIFVDAEPILQPEPTSRT
jgi:cation diffusion facilitator family transporter